MTRDSGFENRDSTYRKAGGWVGASPEPRDPRPESRKGGTYQ